MNFQSDRLNHIRALYFLCHEDIKEFDDLNLSSTQDKTKLIKFIEDLQVKISLNPIISSDIRKCLNYYLSLLQSNVTLDDQYELSPINFYQIARFLNIDYVGFISNNGYYVIHSYHLKQSEALLLSLSEFNCISYSNLELIMKQKKWVFFENNLWSLHVINFYSEEPDLTILINSIDDFSQRIINCFASLSRKEYNNQLLVFATHDELYEPNYELPSQSEFSTQDSVYEVGPGWTNDKLGNYANSLFKWLDGKQPHGAEGTAGGVNGSIVIGDINKFLHEIYLEMKKDPPGIHRFGLDLGCGTGKSMLAYFTIPLNYFMIGIEMNEQRYLHGIQDQLNFLKLWSEIPDRNFVKKVTI
jgi:hypothetical protein